LNESISVTGLSADQNIEKATVLSHTWSCLNGHIQQVEHRDANKRPHKFAHMQFGGNPIMAELVSGVIQVTVQKYCNGSFQGFRIDPKRSLIKMFDNFTTIYANEDKFLQFFFLNSRILENETPEQVEMDGGAHIEGFYFLNFLGGGNLVEMDVRNIYVHFAVRTVDPDLMDEAVDVLRGDSTVNKVIKMMMQGTWRDFHSSW
jgi:hypothetical protein